MKNMILILLSSILMLTLTLSACTSNKFPTGVFEHELINGLIFVINKEHTWAYYVNNLIVASGTYSINGEEFIVETDKVNGSINPNFATYTWSYHNNILCLHLNGDNNPPECFRNLTEKTGARYLEPVQSFDA